MRAGWRLAAVAAVLGAVTVALGAFGAHGLEGTVTPARLETWRTGASYGLAHALAAALAGVWAGLRPSGAALWAGRLLLVGAAVFSGSLYALVLLDLPVLGAVAPIGGVAMIGGWGALAVAAWREARAASGP